MLLPSISVIIPTRNGESTLSELLSLLTVQTVPVEEIIVIDSSSEDQTTTIAQKHGAAVIEIDVKAFDHGGTRTAAARQAKGDIVIFFTQDAIPANREALEKLVQPFLEDIDIAVSYGRQLPSFEANIFAAHLRYFNYPEQSEVRSLDDKKRLGLRTIFASNSFCAYRKSVLEDVGYFKNGLIFGEDTCTVARILLQKKKIAYVADACVYHSHNYTVIEDFKRYFDIGVLHSMEKWLLETYGGAEKRGLDFLKSEMSLLARKGKYHYMPFSLLKVLDKFIAYKLGRSYSHFPLVIVKQLSMHKTWWRKSI